MWTSLRLVQGVLDLTPVSLCGWTGSQGMWGTGVGVSLITPRYLVSGILGCSEGTWLSPLDRMERDYMYHHLFMPSLQHLGHCSLQDIQRVPCDVSVGSRVVPLLTAVSSGAEG